MTSEADAGPVPLTERWSLRLRIFLFFCLIAAGAALVIVAAMVLAARRIGPEATAPLTLFGGLAIFAIVGLTLWVWRLFDENVARAVTSIAGALRAAAHVGVGQAPSEIAARARYMGALGPAVAEAAATFAEMHRAASEKVAQATADAERQKAQLAAVLRDLDQGVVIATLEHRTLLFNRRAVDVLHAAGEIGLGRDLLRLVDGDPIRAALDLALARLDGPDPHPEGASAPVATTTSDAGCALTGRLTLVLDDEGRAPIGYLIRFDDPDDAPARAAAPERPEFYDFDLFHRPVVGPDDATRLDALTYVVFDTETTGLEPSRGDELVSIGAVRIVNNRLVRGETFDQLINPERHIPRSATLIHGIDDAQVADAPKPPEALRRFHRFADGAVLVAHNAAFDMRFLELKQRASGVRFDHPVLDTVLLGAHLLGAQEELTLDALCARFGVTIEEKDRHTALGDALATAELFLSLSNMLIGAGVETLGAARDASEKMLAIRRKQRSY